MQALSRYCVAIALFFSLITSGSSEESDSNKKHHHHKKHHHNKRLESNDTAAASPSHVHGLISRTTSTSNSSVKGVAEATQTTVSNASTDVLATSIQAKLKKLEENLAKKEKAQPESQGKMEVSGPLPTDFSKRFLQAAADAAGCNPDELDLLTVESVDEEHELAEVLFKGPKDIVSDLEQQAGDASSKLANGALRTFLIAHDADASDDKSTAGSAASLLATAQHAPEDGEHNDGKIDIDTAMPYGELEPFGREDTAQELTESSVKESDQMVDQLERAEVAEEKRAVFRALTRLRGAAITSFDGVARSQTGNIDEYNKVHQWRNTHPLHHLADEESDISKWAFPDNADF